MLYVPLLGRTLRGSCRGRRLRLFELHWNDIDDLLAPGAVEHGALGSDDQMIAVLRLVVEGVLCPQSIDIDDRRYRRFDVFGQIDKRPHFGNDLFGKFLVLRSLFIHLHLFHPDGKLLQLRGYCLALHFQNTNQSEKTHDGKRNEETSAACHRHTGKESKISYRSPLAVTISAYAPDAASPGATGLVDPSSSCGAGDSSDGASVVAGASGEAAS